MTCGKHVDKMGMHTFFMCCKTKSRALLRGCVVLNGGMKTARLWVLVTLSRNQKLAVDADERIGRSFLLAVDNVV